MPRKPANVKCNLLVNVENVLVINITNLQPTSASKTQIQVQSVYPLSQGTWIILAYRNIY